MEQANVESAKRYVVDFLVHGDVSVANELADPDLCKPKLEVFPATKTSEAAPQTSKGYPAV
jgi:hypothetical protein